ncbi:phasin family protein [uncultured Erythrobacter sp.]|uniref:phasin family protein n=1 Tax=uncultured Erythrobacter sp. TaxID=263913 RepID=UPI002630C78B|nr:phasin family protein [uncultured Erythrobacter sp.]
MAEASNTSKIDAAAEKAYAEAAAKKAPAPKPAAKAKTVKKPATTAAKKTAAASKAPVKKASAKKPVAKKAAAKKAPAKRVPVKAAAKAVDINPVSKLKDTIMATAEKADFTAQAKELAADVQTRVKGAYGKATELASEAGEFNKANVEAVVESGKILFTGAQDMVKSDVETGKTVFEIVTEDAKKVAAIKSPTELFELQGEIARRNFDAAVSFGSKRTEAIVKLYNDAFAPISNRVSVAAEKVSKAA